MNSEQYLHYVVGGVFTAVLKIVGYPAEKYPDTEMIKFILKSIKTYHAYLVPQEIIYAFELASNGIFGDDVSTKHYHSLSLEYVAKVLDAYKTYRSKEYKALEAKMNMQERDLQAEQEEIRRKNVQSIKRMLKVAYSAYSETGKRKGLFMHESCYLFLNKNGLIDFGNKQAEIEVKNRAIKEAQDDKVKTVFDPRKIAKTMESYNPKSDAMVITIFYLFDEWILDGLTVDDFNKKIDAL